MKGFNNSYKFYNGEINIDKIDTTNKTLEESSLEVIKWINEKLN